MNSSHKAGTPRSAQLFETAVRHHREGHTMQAESLYREVLEIDSQHAHSLYLLSVIVSESGQKEQAVSLLERAIASDSQNPAFHSNLGLLYRGLGRLDDAIVALERALTLKPDLAVASYNLGLVLADQHRDREALACFERTAELTPDVYAIQLELAGTLARQRAYAKAALHYRRALHLRPDSVPAALDLAKALRELGQLDEAEALCRSAVALEPTNALPQVALGNVFLEQGRVDDAMAAYRRALELNPEHATAEANLGRGLAEIGAIEEAIACLRRAVDRAPEDEVVHGILVYSMPFHPDASDKSILDEARAWSRRHADPVAGDTPRHENDPSPDRRLRIGYVSPDFREHCQSLFTMPLLREHDHREVEVICYSSVTSPDSTTDQLRALADDWREVAGEDDAALARLIHQDRIDILVDLTMHMKAGRPQLFARKPAPVQVSWLAYPGTTGMTAIDYRITDPYLDPPEVEGAYAERSIRLSDTFWCYDPLTDAPQVGPLPLLRNRHPTFGSFNNFCKVNAGVLELWARVLAAIPDSELMMLAPAGEARRRVLEVFGRQGVEPNRLSFVSRVERGEYLKHYDVVDVCLDAFPYNGHTTSLDAFWMGVPVLTLVGNTVVGRAGLSQARNLQLPELIATGTEEFVSAAVELTRDPARLDALRRGLRERMTQSPLMDAPRFARSLETAYRQVWRVWCSTRSSGSG